MNTLMNRYPDLADPRRLISIDAEFADGRYMLELSMCDAEGTPVYSRRFRPVKIRTWQAYPHNITPEMVADAPAFKECIGEISAILSHADYVTGFALENDIRKLESEGLRLPAGKKIIELREWFWTLYGLGHGLDLTRGIGNQSVAEYLGVPVEDESLHTSAYDARLSVESLGKLVDAHAGDFTALPTMAALYDAVTAKYESDKDLYDRRMSAGYCFITFDGERYRLKSSHKEPDNEPGIIAMIQVEDRKEAMVYFSNLFLGRIMEGNLSLPKPTERKLARFRSYRNTYTPGGRQMASKIMQLAKKFR